MAVFFNTWFEPVQDISPQDVLFACGCTALCEMLGFSLFEPGEGILFSMPMYQSFQRDFGLRAQVKPVFVPCKDGVGEFDLERVKQYEDAIQDAKERGTTIRAILIGNPHNPLGRCYPPEALEAYMKLCQKHSIHFIVDEVYALSIYGSLTDEKVVPFKSILSMETDKYIDKNLLHLLYGFSKDFSLAGLRLGCLWSRNTDLQGAMAGMSIFSYASNVSDKIGSIILESEKWFKAYVEKNQSTLRTCAEFATALLESYQIPYLTGSYAGFFLLLDLRKYIAGKAPEEVTWDDEKEIKWALKSHGVYLTSGQGLSYEKPCFMRFCFVKEESEVRLGLNRLHDALVHLKSGTYTQ
jgi:1-aminocyclopropane-1-carboxylate synthase